MRNLRQPKPDPIPVVDDFTFVDKETGDIALGRVGCGPCGRVYEEFENRSDQSHFFLTVKDKSVVDKLRSLEDKFRQEGFSSSSTVPVISKRSLMRIYLSD